MMERLVLVGLTRVAAREVAWNAVRALAAAALAGLGWRLGSDAYEVAKKRLAAAPEYDPEEAASQ